MGNVVSADVIRQIGRVIEKSGELRKKKVAFWVCGARRARMVKLGREGSDW